MLRAAAAALVALAALALAVPAWSAIEISGPIATDTTLVAGATYHVTGNLAVAAGVTLTVPEGTVLKAAFGVAITVNGTLDVAGTNANPAYFTEERDGSVGEDVVVGDPGPGAWIGLIIADGGVANIDHLRLCYASRSIGIISASIVVNDG
ncbi:MAG: hypothetical protein JJU31_13280, partial [Wenzhouxiangella sp.]|nr:hypothetical protein [Wenzhouxiangella sp.]